MLRKEDVAAMRIDYTTPVFDESCLVAKEPFMQFDSWFKDATKVQGIGEANAMVLSTCGRLVKKENNNNWPASILFSFENHVIKL